MASLALFWITGGCVLTLTLISQTDAITVTTKYGSLLGSTSSYTNTSGPIKSIHRFLGIPFASPPLGELRFKAPEPPKSWKPSTYDARYYRNVCMQTDSYAIYIKHFWPTFTNANYSEDCLYMNVFTPDRNSSSSPLFPVMVYIHGGAYIWGTPVINPGDQLALRGVVVVTFQYRLGPFGFLSTGDSVASGNYGMLDQVQALKWVKENIKVFGGDPDKVTIFGLSAGSTSVALHLLSPLSKGLFHRAISESGVDLSPWAVHTISNAIYYSQFVAKTLGCDTSDSESIVECLRSKPASSLSMAAAVALTLRKFNDEIAWSPVVDKHFLPDEPKILRKEGKFEKVNYMAGFTSHEGSYFLPLTLDSIVGVSANIDAGVDAATFKKFFGVFSQRRITDKRKAALVSEALEFQYTPWPDTSNPVLLRQSLIDSTTDYDYTAPTHAALSSHSSMAPSFMYFFSHLSKLDTSPAWMGAKHADSNLYILGFPFMPRRYNMSFDETDKNVSLFMMTTWTNFAKTGNPTSEPVSGVMWNQFNSSSQMYLNIGGGIPEMARDFHPHRVAFWNWYYPKLLDTKFGEKPSTVGSLATSVVPQGVVAELLLGVLAVALCGVMA